MPLSSCSTGFPQESWWVMSSFSQLRPVFFSGEDARWIEKVLFEELSELDGLLESLRRLKPLTRELKNDPNDRKSGR
ncbi:MAG: hypothetical protein L6R40_001599 [Gallowayella cf. fulva]|nr:MAG: hypothetical protein L6R40_001599 [Xanthomendoza cf. fulva]